MWNELNFWHIFLPVELLYNYLNLGYHFSQKKKKNQQPSSCSERLILQLQVETENETISSSE